MKLAINEWQSLKELPGKTTLADLAGMLAQLVVIPVVGLIENVYVRFTLACELA